MVGSSEVVVEEALLFWKLTKTLRRRDLFAAFPYHRRCRRRRVDRPWAGEEAWVDRRRASASEDTSRLHREEDHLVEAPSKSDEDETIMVRKTERDNCRVVDRSTKGKVHHHHHRRRRPWGIDGLAAFETTRDLDHQDRPCRQGRPFRHDRPCRHDCPCRQDRPCRPSAVAGKSRAQIHRLRRRHRSRPSNSTRNRRRCIHGQNRRVPYETPKERARRT